MKFNIYYLLLLALLILPVGVLAAPATFTPLVGIPGIDQYTGPGSLNLYINALYRLSISIAALLAVIKIVAAGAKYMLSDIITHKEDAKKDIQGALIGLLIVIGAIIILNTVNSDLTKLNLDVPVQEITQSESIERALYNAITEACDKPGRAAACETLTCEGWVFNGVEVREGEDIIQACRRVCLRDLRGAFDPKLFDPKSSTCRYDPTVAKKCDPNSSKTCCEDMQKATWYAGHNKCYGTGQPFKKIECSTSNLFRTTDEPSCSAARKQCAEEKGTTISQVSKDPNATANEKFYGSILCSVASTVDNNPITRNAVIKKIAQDLTFNTTPIQSGTLVANELEAISDQLGITNKIITEANIVGVSTQQISTIDNEVPGIVNDLIISEIANNLLEKCTGNGGSKVAYDTEAYYRSNQSVRFYCIK